MKVTLSGGAPEPGRENASTPTSEKRSSGQYKDYWVLPMGDGVTQFDRPLRFEYTHTLCNTNTRMGYSIAATFARDHAFYGSTFCCHCGQHFPVDQFFWDGTSEKVGS